MGGCEVKMDIPMVGQELADAFGLMSREVIRNDVNLTLAWLASNQIG